MNLLGAYTPQIKRRNVFFSFHYGDIMRVNNVRNSGKFKTVLTGTGRVIEGYYDRSLWERRKLEGEESLRRLIRTGVQNTSAICVLIGSMTWQRPWVRYEIARSVIDERGLLAIHINSLPHHQDRSIDPPGDNPCRYMGIALSENGKYYLCERVPVQSGSSEYKWIWYTKYTHPVSVPRYMPKPVANEPIRLSDCINEYDWILGNGSQNIGAWIDQAAQNVGR